MAASSLAAGTGDRPQTRVELDELWRICGDESGELLGVGGGAIRVAIPLPRLSLPEILFPVLIKRLLWVSRTFDHRL